MQVLRKSYDELILIHSPAEKVEVGESLEVVDLVEGRGLLAQVIEQGLLNLPGVLESIIRSEASGGLELVELAPDERIQDYLAAIYNMKVVRAKIRKEVRYVEGGGEVLPWSGWSPTRCVKVERVGCVELAKKLGVGLERPIAIGTTQEGGEFVVSARDLQGINIIVGRKGTGKSHLAKAILLGLIDNGAVCVVLDVNDEYSGLRYTREGEGSRYFNRIVTLEPGARSNPLYRPLKFTLDSLGLEVVYSVLTDSLGLPEASAYTFRRLWEDLRKEGPVTLDRIEGALNIANERVAEAIYKRLSQIRSAGIVADDSSEGVDIERALLSMEGTGGALVINLRAKGPLTQRIVVQAIVAKLQRFLESGRSRPIFIFAEEAHFYIPQTAWLDLVTRMRHLGAFQFYLTNTPTSIDQSMIRQADNAFIFNLTDDRDLEHILPATKVDRDTVMSVVRVLPPRAFLAVGEATGHYPFIIKTRALPYMTAGETKLLWEGQGR